ncbi:hypothetical protein BDR06DRAFT_972974 [Suillus hirtellus]|nr:hypothetical protein BDR06DRAFT_972974 [Suillus hirtellus]
MAPNLKESLNDADDEGDGGTKWHRKKPRKDSKFILNIKITIYNLTSIITSEIRKPQDHEDSDGESDTNDKSGETPALLKFNFTGDVSTPANRTICECAIRIIWSKQQPAEKTFNLTHKGVKFNKVDMLAFAKDKFCNYKRKYEEYTHKEKETDFMSNKLTQLDTDNETRKWTHQEELKKAAQLTTAVVKDGVAIWEVLNIIMDKLDDICGEQQKKMGNNTTWTRCINLGNTNPAPPQLPIFPFMLNTNWYKTYMADNPSATVAILKKDLVGFGT